MSCWADFSIFASSVPHPPARKHSTLEREPLIAASYNGTTGKDDI